MASPALGKSSDEAGFLAALGRRVRERRDEAGLTRRRLSELSGLSERYLAQLESGDGNISILLIRRVAEALHCSLEQLLSDQASDPEIASAIEVLRTLEPGQRHQAVAALQQRFGEMSRERARRIALVGLRGAGKSTLGARLAARLKVPFFELDQQIERELGAGLESIFSMYGQDTYRDAERRVLDRLTRTHRRCVIAAGGSLVLEPLTYELLRERCLTIWLKASPEEHMDRVIAQGDLRPIRGRDHAMAELRTILKQRDRLYAMADAAVDTTGIGEAESLKRLVDVIAVASPLAGSSAREAPAAPG
jgi:XRE family aerobic/anaerobic benzoate catabolism transcriptional regulator